MEIILWGIAAIVVIGGVTEYAIKRTYILPLAKKVDELEERIITLEDK